MEDSQEADFADWERALRVLNEAIEQSKLEEFTEYPENELVSNRWRIYKRTHQGDISLLIFVSGLFGILHWEFFLLKGAHWIIEEVENLLRQPYADKLFDLSGEETLDDIVNLHARLILLNYINFLPQKMFQAISQGFDDTIRNYIKNIIEPVFKSHWETLGLPKDFTLLSRDELKKHDKQFEELRKIFIGEKRSSLNPQQLASLNRQYQSLRQDYSKARRHHKSLREAFIKNNPTIRNKEDAWRESWSNIYLDLFPSLRPECLELLDQNYAPYELALKHMALLYRHSDEYMKKLIQNHKKVSKKKQGKSNNHNSKKRGKLPS